jgi:hypothetical protein
VKKLESPKKLWVIMEKSGKYLMIHAEAWGPKEAKAQKREYCSSSSASTAWQAEYVLVAPKAKKGK